MEGDLWGSGGTILHQKRLAHPIDAPGRTDVERPDIFVCYYFHIFQRLEFSAILMRASVRQRLSARFLMAMRTYWRSDGKPLLAGTVLDENIVVPKQP